MRIRMYKYYTNYPNEQTIPYQFSKLFFMSFEIFLHPITGIDFFI